MPTLFISDLHLCAERPQINQLFVDFLSHRARQADALYILGDLFEYWIGDEAIHQDEFRPLVDALRQFAASGVPLYLMHGNRDFLLGQDFETATGGRLLSDPTIIDLYGTNTLIMHGDTLCTDDTEYMAFRAMVRDEKWQRAFLSKSVAQRDQIRRSFREMSHTATAEKKVEIMDVAQQTVESVMRKHGVHRLIHGHTHRPKEHIFDLDGANARRMVLGAWYEQGSVLRCDKRGWALETLSLAMEPEKDLGGNASKKRNA